MKNINANSFLYKVAKIEKIPKNVSDSIPFTGILKNGIIETIPGTYTKTYKLSDIDFLDASEEDEQHICEAFQEFISSIDQRANFQFTIFNYKSDKKETLKQVRFLPQKDSLNKYRSEMNNIILGALQNGEESISRDKYITVSIKDVDVDHAVQTLNKIDIQINNGLRTMCGEPAALSSTERLKLLHSIYNQDYNYKLSSDIFEDPEFNLNSVFKNGLSVKDIIGPSSMDFNNPNYFMLGETYASTLYLDHIPGKLTTKFLADFYDIQYPMLVSTTTERIAADKALKLVKSKLSAIEAKSAEITSRNAKDGILTDAPVELQNAQNSAREIMQNITVEDQELFLTTLTITVFAPTKEKLLNVIALVENVADSKHAPIKVLPQQQEFAFNTSLPLCRNDLYTDILFTTESECALLPFSSRDIYMPNSIYYGINRLSKNIIMYDRKTGNNYNGLIFGSPGSGKSFIAKVEMIENRLRDPNAQVIIIDPQGEYAPLARNLKGQEVKLSVNNKFSKAHINPLDIDLGDDDAEVDAVSAKIDYLLSFFNIIRGEDGLKLSPSETTILDKSIKRIYAPYIDYLEREGKTCDVSRCPTLTDLYEDLKLLGRDNDDAKSLSEELYSYTHGSFNCFAERTNFETSAKFVIYNTKALGSGLLNLGLYVCLSDIMNRIIQNHKKGIFTYVYIDEFHMLLQSPDATKFVTRIWKTVRKWGGIPTGIMQNTNDLILDETADGIFNNTSFMLIMYSSKEDRDNLQVNLGLSDTQISFVSKPEPGCGLLYNGKFASPFKLIIPKDSEIFELIDTNPNNIKR